LDSRFITFATFADDPNLSRAAKRLHLSQPAVHAQLRALAEDLGVALYRRSGRGLVLTPEGIEVAAFAREEAARESELRARLSGGEPDQPVIVAAGAGAIVHLLAPGFRRTKQRIEVITADASQALDLVRSGRAHIGVGVFPSAPSDVDVTKLVEAEQVLVVRRDDLLAKKRRVSLGDLAGRDVIAPPEGGPQRAALGSAFAAARITAVARGWDVVLRLVEVGVGIGIVNATCALPRSLVGKPLRELPRVTYFAFTRARARAAVLEVLRALAQG
jgi:DNA-binding transcriptional LysR family regulator